MRGPIELLEDSLAIFNKNPALYLTIYAALGVATVIAELFAPRPEHGPGYTGSMIEHGGQMAASPLYPLLMIVSVVISIFVTIALVKAIAEPNVTAKQAFQFAKERALNYFILSVMVGVTVFVGFVLLIIPGIIAMTWFGFAYLVYFFEGTKGIDAMKASKALVEGHFMQVFGRYIALFLAFIVASIAVGIIGGMFKEPLFTSILMALANAVLVPVAIAYVYLMYKDLVALRATPAVAAADGSVDAPAALSAAAVTPTAHHETAEPSADAPAADGGGSSN